MNGKPLVNFSEIREMSTINGFTTANFANIHDSEEIQAN